MVKDTHRYINIDDVYRTSGIRADVISRQDVEDHIERAEVFACRLTKNIYYKYNLENENVATATNNTITINDGKWSINAWKNQYVTITSGTGSGQYRKILQNNSSSLTTNDDWDIVPDATSSFSIFYVPKSFNPYKDFTDKKGLDGNGKKHMFLPYYPVNKIDYLNINDVDVDPETLYLYESEGKVELSHNSAVTTFLRTYPKQVKISFWYGVPEITDDVKRLVELKAALAVLQQQMGGTFDVPSTFSLPDLSVSIGQAYINIKGTVDVLQKEYDDLVQRIRIYPVFA